MGTDPNSPDNRCLRDAMQRQIPVVYFLSTLRVIISPSFRHSSLVGTRIACGSSLRSEQPWGLRLKPCHLTDLSGVMRFERSRRGYIRHRSGMRFSRPMGDGARSSTCPDPRLLDAAHIVIDADEQLGQPVVSNGLPLTKLHYAAFDTHLIGIDPDFRIHVFDRLLEIHDGPFLELGLKGIAGQLIDRPRRLADHPDRERLAIRFEKFRKAA
jgi:putative restriction endonuclease